MGLVFNPNKFSSTKRAARRGGPSWEDYKYYLGKDYGWLNPLPVIRSWLQPDVSTILQDPQQRQAIQNALLNALQDPKQQQVVQDMLLNALQDPKQQQVVQDMILKALQDPKQQQVVQDMILKGLQDPQYQQVFQDMILKGLQDPQLRQVIQEMISKGVQDPKLRQQFESEIGKKIGGYATLPVLLALLSSIFTDKPIIPILLGLAGLGIAHFFPEVRANVNVAKWFSEKKPEPPAGSAPEGTQQNRPQTEETSPK